MSKTFVNDIIPHNDAQRLEVLRRYQMSNTQPEESLNNIAHLMAEFFSVPIALVTLVDKEKVYFKGNVGMPGVKQTDRTISLCSFAILSSEPTVFDKPLEEPCLLSNPLVHGDFGLRFYAGAPLITSDGFNLGSVCIIDKKERSFSARQQDMLKRFSKIVIDEIELRQAIIKQVQIGQELSISQERFDLVSKATQDAIWDWNLTTNEIWWNEGFKELFGYTEEEIEPTVDSWYNRVHPDDRDWVANSIHEVIDSGGKQWSAEYRFQKKDGSFAIVYDRGYALHDKEGKPYRMLGSMQDITERKKNEEELIQKDKNFRSIVNQAPVAISVLRGEEFVFDVVNEKMLHLINKNSAVIGKPLFEAMPEMQDQPVIEVLRTAFSTGEPFYGNELLVPLVNGDVWQDRYFNFTYQPLIEEGKIVGIMTVATEVTEQVTARRKIQQSHQELQFVMDIMPAMVWNTLPDGTAYFFNQVYLDYTGLSLDLLKGHQWIALLYAEDIDVTSKVWQQALSSGSFYEVEHRLRSRDGSYRWFLTRGVPLKDEKGQIMKWYGTSTDIHEQKQAETILEQRVKERTKELEMRNKELEQFTYVSHHDLQEPLRKIVMFTDMIKSEATQKLSESSQVRLQKISDAAVRMSAALRDVLDFASLSKAEQFIAVDLDEVLAAAQGDLELVISEKKAIIISDTLPIIKGVPNQMHQLLYNLISNALKFSKTGVPPHVIISCKELQASELVERKELDPSKKYYLVTIQDNGIGFNQGHAEKIFDMFQRLHSKEAFSGTGIGLALVKKVVQNHSGFIWAEGREGIGATFHVLLPVEQIATPT
jgi:PAS domain S-box-containing protein